MMLTVRRFLMKRPKDLDRLDLGLALVIAAALTVVLLPSAGAQQIRCWTNASGSRECSDLPPPADAKAVSDVRGRAGRIDGQESFSQKQASERFPVTLWSNDCGEPCTNARKLLTSRGVPFTDRNPATPEAAEEFKRLTKGQLQVPMLMVGTTQLSGFEEGQWHSTLDAAGYSRVAGVPRKPAPAPAAAAAPRPPGFPPTAGGPAGAPGVPPGMPGPGTPGAPGAPGAAGAPGPGGGAPVQTGPGGTVVPPQNTGGSGPGGQTPGFAAAPSSPGGPGAVPGQPFSPAGPGIPLPLPPAK
jgi:glutaredoxin